MRVGATAAGGQTSRVSYLLLLEGDGQDNGDHLLLEGDAQSGGDALKLEGDEAAATASHTKRVLI